MTTGTAYCFFRTSCIDGGITAALRKAKPDWKPEPESLIKGGTRFSISEISCVKQGAWLIKGDEEAMVTAAQQWRCNGANCFIRLRMSDATNKDTASALQSVLTAFHSESIIGIAAIHFRDHDGTYTHWIQGQ